MFFRQSLITAAKASAFAVVCVPVAAGAHVLAGGALSREPVLLAGMPIAAIAYVFARRGPRRAVWLLSVFTVAQALLHSFFAQTAGGHGAHGADAAAAMAGLHFAAGLVAVLWVVRIEPALPRQCERLATAARRLIDLLRLPECGSPRRSSVMPCRPRRARHLRVVGAVGLRGPPTRPAPSPVIHRGLRPSRGPPEKAAFTMSRTVFGRALARAAIIGSAAAIAAASFAGSAAAHVTISTANTVAGTYTLLTVSVPHGCDGEATTAIAIQIPEPLNAVTPSVNPNWEVEKVMADLPEPVVDAHGNEVTERVDQVVYTAITPLPDGLRDSFELSLRLPEEAAGQTLYFPVVQTCTAGDHPWIEIPEDGQNPDELESPAPFIEVIDADAAEAAGETGIAEDNAGDDGDDGETDPVTYVALAVGMIGAGLGAFALVRGRRRA